MPIISPVEPLALRVADACRAVGIGKTLFYHLAKEGSISLTRVGGRTLVPVEELRRLLARGSVTAAPTGCGTDIEPTKGGARG